MTRRAAAERVAPGWLSLEQDGYTLQLDQQAAGTASFAESVAQGLEQRPRRLHCRWLYDEIGSQLYERITEQPEYYLTRTEDDILATHAEDIRGRAGNAVLVELGSGSAAKTRHLLDAWTAAGSALYVPVDISRSALEAACADLAPSYPGLRIEAVAASFRRGLALARSRSPLTLAFLGSTVGNLDGAELEEFLELVSTALSPGDSFLLGIDLVKDRALLEAAYDDAAGWTARFTLNLFARMNRELGSHVPIESLEHVAIWNPESEQIEIYARFHDDVTIDLPPVQRSFRVEAGEMVRVEISRKFHVEGVAAEMERFGLGLERTYTDPERMFAVLLLRR